MTLRIQRTSNAKATTPPPRSLSAGIESPISRTTPRLLCFDLENRPLAYWYDGETTSEITAFGWKWSDQDVVRTMLLTRDGQFRVDDYILGFGLAPYSPVYVSDWAAYSSFMLTLSSADLVYGHNIRKHDLPMFNAGLLRRQLPILPALRTTDTLKDYPRRGGMSASLENLAAMYGLEGEKKTMRQPDWEKANRLTPDGLELARERVASDVLLQERLRERVADILKPPSWWRP